MVRLLTVPENCLRSRPRNVPAFIEKALISPGGRGYYINKTFDNGTICSSEQAVIVEEPVASRVIDEFIKQGAYIAAENEIKLLENTVMLPNGGVNPKVVGQTPETVAGMAGINIPGGTRVIIAKLNGAGKGYPLSYEKLCPVLGFYIEKDWQSACERCIELLELGGLGHSLVIHSRNEEIIREFAIKKPVNRILVNTPSSQGAIGYTTGLQPSLTLGWNQETA